MAAGAAFGRRAGGFVAVLAGVTTLVAVLTVSRSPARPVALDSLDSSIDSLIAKAGQPLPFRRFRHANSAARLSAEQAASYQSSQRDLAGFDHTMPPVGATSFDPEDHLDAHANLWLTGSGSGIASLDADAENLLGHARPAEVKEPHGLGAMRGQAAAGTPEGVAKSERYQHMRAVMDAVNARIAGTEPVPVFVKPVLAASEVAPMKARAAAALVASKAANTQQKYNFYPLSSPEGQAAWAAYNSSPEGRAAAATRYSAHYGSGYNPFGVSSADQIPDGLLTE